MATAFWLCVALVAYVFAGYPLLVGAWAATRPRPVRRRRHEPRVSIIVAAFNEAARIGARIDDLAALDYPPDRLEILIGSDGSTDDTAHRAAAAAGGRARVVAFPVRRGKPAVVNDLWRAPRARSSCSRTCASASHPGRCARCWRRSPIPRSGPSAAS